MTLSKQRLEHFWQHQPNVLTNHLLDELLTYTQGQNVILHYEPIAGFPHLVKITVPTKKQKLKIFKLIKAHLQKEGYHLQFWQKVWRRFISEKPISLAEFCQKQNYLNLDTASFDDFLSYIFHSNMTKSSKYNGKKSHNFYCHDLNWVEGNFNRLIDFYTQLFENSELLIENLSLGRINHLLNNILDFDDDSVKGLIFNSKLDLVKRLKLIESLYFLYKNVFQINPIRYHCNMLWDGLAYCYTMDSAPYGCTQQDYWQIQATMFSTLTKILQLPSKDCQAGALHGLNHVRHPDTEIVIRQYLADHPALSEDEIDYATYCMKFEMM